MTVTVHEQSSGCLPSTNSTVLASTNGSAGTLTFAWAASGTHIPAVDSCTAGVGKGAAFVGAARTTIKGMPFSTNMAGETAAEMGAELECVNGGAMEKRGAGVGGSALACVVPNPNPHPNPNPDPHAQVPRCNRRPERRRRR